MSGQSQLDDTPTTDPGPSPEGDRLALALEASGAECVDWSAAEGLQLGAGLAGWLGLAGTAGLRLQPEQVLARLAPEDRPRALQAARQHAEGRSAVLDVEVRVVGPGREPRWIHLRGKVTARDAKGRPAQGTGIALDVTERHRTRQQLVHAERLGTLGQLAAGVAHEVAGPLGCVLVCLRLLEDGLRADPAGESRAARLDLLGDALAGAGRVREIVAGLRSLARQVDEPPRLLDLGAELAVAVTLARHEVVSRARLVSALPDRLPAVLAHTGELSQVFLNLLLNAAQAIPEGRSGDDEIRVSAAVEGRTVTVEVRDSGSGIAPEHQRRLFEPFFTTKPAGRGTGLGLSICRTIVESAGGRISCQSDQGRGSTFRVELPAAPDQPLAAGEGASQVVIPLRPAPAARPPAEGA